MFLRFYFYQNCTKLDNEKIMNQNMSCHLHILNIYSIKLYTCNHCIFYYIYSRRIIQWFIKNFQCGKLFLFIYLHKRNTKLRKLRYDSFWPSNNFPSGRRPPCIIGLLERSYNMFTDHQLLMWDSGACKRKADTMIRGV